MCRVGSHIDEMSYTSKTLHRSVAALYSYSGLPYQVFYCAVVKLPVCLLTPLSIAVRDWRDDSDGFRNLLFTEQNEIFPLLESVYKYFVCLCILSFNFMIYSVL